LSVFSGQLEKVAEGYKDEDFENREMYLKQFVIARNSPFCGRTIRESGIRNKYHCLVVGIESADDSNLRQPEVSFELQKGDVVWVVGEEKNLNALFEASEVTAKAE
jgi:monovalent cation:H+ antiporter-2, CPA2 family